MSDGLVCCLLRQMIFCNMFYEVISLALSEFKAATFDLATIIRADEAAFSMLRVNIAEHAV